MLYSSTPNCSIADACPPPMSSPCTGDLSAYEEVEAFPTTPRAASPERPLPALAGNPFQRRVPASSDAQPPPPAAATAALSLVDAQAPGAAAGRAETRDMGRGHLPPPPAHLRPAPLPAHRAPAGATQPERSVYAPLAHLGMGDAAKPYAAEAAHPSGACAQQQARSEQQPFGSSSCVMTAPPAQAGASGSSHAIRPLPVGAVEDAAGRKQAAPPPPPPLPPLQQQQRGAIGICAGALADAAGRLRPAARGKGAPPEAQVRLAFNKSFNALCGETLILVATPPDQP